MGRPIACKGALVVLAAGWLMHAQAGPAPAAAVDRTQAANLAACRDPDQRGAEGPRDAEELQRVRQGAEQGTDECALLLGHWSELGKGVPRDLDAARRLYAQAAPSDGDAAFALGQMAEAGRGMPQDYAEARREYARAADNGSAAAAVALGRLNERGLGGAVDLTAAAGAYEDAALRSYDDAGWAALDALQAKAIVQAPEDVERERQVWNQLMSRRVSWQVKSHQLHYADERKAIFKLTFARGARRPAVDVLRSSGDAEFDAAAADLLKDVEVPPAPIFDDPAGAMSVDLPFEYRPASASLAGP